jgi:hypothetical protein
MATSLTPSRLATRPVASAKLKTSLARVEKRVSVFVAGPFLDPHWTESDLQGKSASALLRFHLSEHVKLLECDLILGEHRGVREITSESIPTSSSVAASELALVRSADAVIIIPDSPGSFCELGSWAMIETVCRKSMILPNAQFQNEQGYLQDALLPFLAHEYARIEWVDYTDHGRAIELAEDFIGRITDRVVIRGLISDR